MSIYKVLGFLLVVLLGGERPQAQDALRFNTQKPVSGQPIELEYDASKTILKNKQLIHCVAYLYQQYDWHVVDLPLQPNGNTWRASIDCPKDCGFMAFKFFSGDTVDNNHNLCYATMFYDENNRQSAGAAAGWVLLRRQANRLVNLNYVSPSAQASDTAVLYWLSLEFRDHPEARDRLAATYAAALYHVGQTSELQQVLDFLLKKVHPSENDLLLAREIYIQKNDFTRVDSLDKQQAALYPEGNIARLMAYRKTIAYNDPDTLEKATERFLQNFPENTGDRRFNLQYKVSYDDLYEKTIVLSMIRNNDAPLKQYLNHLSFFGLFNTYHKLVEIPNGGNKLQTPEYLYPYSNLLVKKMEAVKTLQPGIALYQSPYEWQLQYETLFVNYVLKTHINILRNVGRYDEALKYAEYVQPFVQYKDYTFNEDYAFILQAKGMHKKLRGLLFNSIYQNQCSPAMVAMLKEDYLKQHSEASRFEAYLDSLKKPSNTKQQLQVMLVQKKMPEWKMYDANHHPVTSKALLGKVVVLDFWANWCAPCKASFPAMNMLVEKYKKDSNIVFLFVDTGEALQDKYKEKATAYMKQHQYDFRVVFDNPYDDRYTGEWFHKLANMVNESGIPFKVIIDQNGWMRYASSENTKSPTELMDMIAHILTLIKIG